MYYGRAKVGDRTMLDSLNAAALALEVAIEFKPDDELGVLAAVAAATEEAAKKTVGLKAGIGKASDYSKDLLLLLPDPGAHAVGIWMRAVYEGCRLFL
jgi:dihydroxyacetone kinase